MKLVIYKTKFGPQRGFRWRLLAANSKVLCHGGQGYSRRTDMVLTLEKVLGGSLSRGGLWRRLPATGDWVLIPVEDRTKDTR